MPVANTVRARIGAIGEFAIGQQQQVLFGSDRNPSLLSGAGGLSASAVSGWRATLAFGAAGSLSAVMAQASTTNPATFVGGGAVTAAGFIRNFFIGEACNGTGNVSAALFVMNFFLYANFGGRGRFCASASVRTAAPGRQSNVSTSGPGPTNNPVV